MLGRVALLHKKARHLDGTGLFDFCELLQAFASFCKLLRASPTLLFKVESEVAERTL